MQIFSKVIYSFLFHENGWEEVYIFKKTNKRRRKKKTPTLIKMLIGTENCSYKEVNQANIVCKN